MKLKAYLESKKVTKTTTMTMSELAQLLDVEVSTISRICSGEVRPSWAVMDKISLATGGKVTPNDFQAAK